jgi:hypothetical protein
MLGETGSLMELTSVDALETHPAVTLLRNLALGSCKLQELEDQEDAMNKENEVTLLPPLRETTSDLRSSAISR